MLKRVFIVVLSIIVIIGVSGCIGKKETKKYTIEEKKEMILAYLRDKYDEEFEGISYSQVQWGQEQDEFYVYPKSGSKEDAFGACGYQKEDGTYSMADGYFGIIIHDEYKRAIEEIADEIYEEFKLNVLTNLDKSIPDILNKDTKVSEIYDKSKGEFSPWIAIYVKQSFVETTNMESNLKELGNKFIKNKLGCAVTFYLVSESVYESIGTESFYLSTDDIVKEKNFIINKNLEIIKYGEEK